MASNVLVPTLGESVSEAILSQWLKSDGDRVTIDEPICELESDKATVDLPAPASGILHLKKRAGETARVGEVIAEIEAVEEPSSNGRNVAPPAAEQASGTKASGRPGTTQWSPPGIVASAEIETHREADASRSPSAATASPPKAVETKCPPPLKPKVEEPKNQRTEEPKTQRTESQPPRPRSSSSAAEGTRREPMSRLRRSIAERLVRAQQTAAMLTTFNEIDMTAVQELRAQHGEKFKEVHGVGLGFMSFFARAAALALKQFPNVNAMIDGDEIVYHDHVHLGVAVSTDRGLVVPVLRNVENMSFAKIESEIKRAATAARDGKLALDELSGGTFTITNGGVFGSLLSTPILNPPQSGILGMHTIQERPIAIQGQVVIRPMMYVALTYDHRLVDGKEAVSFLVRIKSLLENPMQMILEI